MMRQPASSEGDEHEPAAASRFFFYGLLLRTGYEYPLLAETVSRVPHWASAAWGLNSATCVDADERLLTGYRRTLTAPSDPTHHLLSRTLALALALALTLSYLPFCAAPSRDPVHHCPVLSVDRWTCLSVPGNSRYSVYWLPMEFNDEDKAREGGCVGGACAPAAHWERPVEPRLALKIAPGPSSHPHSSLSQLFLTSLALLDHSQFHALRHGSCPRDVDLEAPVSNPQPLEFYSASTDLGSQEQPES
ncbi:hypothetical protein CCHR01_11317 [Colletotrichum chrysophilum]|uniref:Uncharacterized protein n=1 Tax=Colletotrichum chrysophilum TaxID=1836956 RepID=A0AAD9ADB5_9PEZI|nr:hypothetical protein CCHR01_11317 [Colletotrichum chrysophilum]